MRVRVRGRCVRNHPIDSTNLLEALLATGTPAAAQVASFAERIGVAPGIVVGRLQHQGVFRHGQLNGLRERHTLTLATTVRVPSRFLRNPTPRLARHGL